MPLLKFSAGQFSSALEAPLKEMSRDEWFEAGRPIEPNLAVLIPNDTEVNAYSEEIIAAPTIILQFPSFADGRAYSQARLLRRAGYSGALRARGDVLFDQIAYMSRCGFDVFEVKSESAAAFNRALKEISYVYQAAADDAAPVWRRRLDRAVAA